MHPQIDRRALLLAAGGTPLASGAAAQGACGFESVLDAHLRSVAARDLGALEATLTRGEELHLILPNGAHTTTRAEYVEFHRRFFADRLWEMTFEPVYAQPGADTALATFCARFTSVQDGRQTWSENWLSLVFRKEGSAWGLVWDQNTRFRTNP